MLKIYFNLFYNWCAVTEPLPHRADSYIVVDMGLSESYGGVQMEL